MQFRVAEGDTVSLKKRKFDTLPKYVVPGESWRVMSVLDLLFVSVSH